MARYKETEKGQGLIATPFTAYKQGSFPANPQPAPSQSDLPGTFSTKPSATPKSPKKSQSTASSTSKAPLTQFPHCVKINPMSY